MSSFSYWSGASRLTRAVRRGVSGVFFLWALMVPLRGAATLPPGFMETDLGSGWSLPMGLEFSPDPATDRAYVWERAGKVWILENGVRLSQPVLDISDEVGSWGHAGLLGFALDPDFLNNGYIYCLYVVDRHHLLYAGTPQYDKNTSLNLPPTIGRLTRYTCRRSDGFRTADPASRFVLLGETKGTGVPVIHTSHTIGSLVFGTDGTLLVSTGDGASFNAMDGGGDAGGSYGTQAVAEGIITAAENTGAYRCQMLDSLSGKILRLDPATGNGVPSNPYYDPAKPRSARSRVWCSGLRNPFRMTLKPGTGEHDATQAAPGTLFIGDVGWNALEEVSMAASGGRNFGWPLYEGYARMDAYWNARPASIALPVHEQPLLDWRHNGALNARALVNGALHTVGAAGSAVAGTNFSGNAITAAACYSGTDFPPEWHGVLFVADDPGMWMRGLVLDSAGQVREVKEFATGEGIIFLTTHPRTGALYYCNLPRTGQANAIRRITYNPGGNRPPVAVAAVDRDYGPSPLTVQFSSAASSDPEGTALSYAWDFGDGTTSTLPNPAKTYTASGARKFTAVLTVRDAGGAQAVSSIVITPNNTPPALKISSPAASQKYPAVPGVLTYPLSASVSDREHSAFTYRWDVTLMHDEHEHPEFTLDSATGSLVFLPLGNDRTSAYWYRIVLNVTDPLGLSTESVRLFAPETTGTVVETYPDMASVPSRGGLYVPVLANDRGAVTDADPASLEIVSAPAFGTATPDPVTGRVLYIHSGGGLADQFSYRVRTRAGLRSAPSGVDVIFASRPPLPVAVSDRAAVAPGGSVTIPVLANDFAPAGSSILPSATAFLTHPSHGVLTWNPAAGTVSYTHNGDDAVSDGFTYSTGDSTGRRTVAGSVSIEIAPPPSVVNPGAQSVVRGSIVSLQMQGSDPRGGALTWSATGLPAGMKIHPSTGLISGTVALGAADSTTCTVTAAASAGSTSVSFAWNARNVPTTPAAVAGLRGEYFAGLTPGGPLLLQRSEPGIAFDWGTGAPAAAVPVDQFSVRWSGELIPRFSENYLLTIAGDNGYRLWLDGVLVIDNWLPTGTSGWRSVELPLTAGRRTPFRLEYYEEWGSAGISLYWSSAQQAWETVPASVFVQPGASTGGTNPHLAGISSTFRIQANATGPVIRFTRRAEAAAQAVLVESSADLKTWTTLDAPATVTRNAQNGEDVEVKAPASAGKRYFRLRLPAP